MRKATAHASGTGPQERTRVGAQDKFVHSSGATSSHRAAPYFFMTGAGDKLTALRFEAGNEKHEDGTPVYDQANWLRALKTRDWKFFRDRAAHARDHLHDEMRGTIDTAPGGNLGAVGWFVDIAAFVAEKDPEFWQVVQGIRHPDDYTTDSPWVAVIKVQDDQDHGDHNHIAHMKALSAWLEVKSQERKGIINRFLDWLLG